MTCQQPLNRIATLTQTLGNCTHLENISSQIAQETISNQQLQNLLTQEIQQRQRLAAELQTLTRQLHLYTKWQETLAQISQPPTVKRLEKSSLTLSREPETIADPYCHTQILRPDSSSTSEEIWKAIFDQSDQFIGILDQQGKIIQLNSTALNLVPETIEQAKNQPFWEMSCWYNEIDRILFKQAIELAQSGKVVRYDPQLLSENREDTSLELSFRPLVDQETQQVNYVIVEGRPNFTDLEKKTTNKKNSESILKTFPGIFYVVSRDGECVRWNRELEKNIGYTHEQIKALDPQDFFIEADQPHVREQIQKAFQEGKSTVRATLYSLNQPPRTYDFTHIQISLSDGETYVICIGNDCTETTLRESQEKYSHLINSLREVVFQVDANGCWSFLNQAWTEITGYSVSETLGQPFLSYTYFEDLADNKKQFQNLINNRNSSCRYEVRHQTRRGELCWIEITARATKNEIGEITGIAGTLKDITQRRKSEDQLKAVINTVPGLVSWVSRDGYYLGVNQQLADTLDLDPEDFLGKKIGFFNEDSSFSEFIYDFLISDDHQSSQVIESNIKGGETRSFLVAAQKYRQASAAVLIGIDITERKQAELALIESENQFRQLAENIEQVFWMVDLTQQTFIYISPAYEKTWGRSVQSAYDSPTDWLESIHPDDYQQIFRATKKQIRGEYDEEYRIVRPDGEIRWIHDRAFPVLNEKGKVYRIAGLAEDITERKRAKEALKKRERYLKALVGVQRRLLASPVDSFLYREVLGILGEACEASRIYVYENLIGEDGTQRGRERAEWCAPNISSEINQDSHQNFSYLENLGRESYEKLTRGEFLQQIISDLPKQQQPFFKSQNLISFLMIPLIVNGEFFGVIGFDNCDVSTSWGRLEVGLLSSAAAAISLAKEKQLTQETLQKQLTAIETTTDGIMIIQPEGHLHYVNPAYCQMLGYPSPRALLETQWRTHHPDEEISRIENEIFPQLESKGSWSGDVCAQRRDGSHFIQELAMNLTQNGEIVGVCRDISDRKHAEEQLKASLEEKELLLKEVHHRVKNNLQVIYSIFSLQSQTLKDKQALAIIEESQNRINSMALIHEKLYQSTNLSNIDFAEYIRDLAYYLLASYNVDPHRIETEMTIESIPLHLDSAIPCGLLINELVSNSLKHGFPNQRSGKIYISLGIEDTQGETLRLKVEDNGVGLPEGFDPTQTTSLGVSLISSLTQQLRGTLKFQNNPGASFEITFPKPIERKRF